MSSIVWFRHDLRVKDNPALNEAVKRGKVIPLFIWAPEEEGKWQSGHMSRAWLKHSLVSLNKSLNNCLILRQGPTLKTLLALLKESGAKALFFNRRYEPMVLKRDLEIIEVVEKKGYTVQTFNASLLVEPWEVCSKGEKPYQVFTPFWKTCLKLAPFEPFSSATPTFKGKSLLSLSLDRLNLPDHPLEIWEIGEEGAMKRLKAFIKKSLSDYDTLRDRPDLDYVSRLSPYLHFGEIGPRQIYKEIKKVRRGEGFLRQLMWREFAYHLLFHFPHTPDHPLHEEFTHFPWEKNRKSLHAWQQGLTGYPIVDAGMRQLLLTGWMHNRVRLIVASFLTKDLLLPWQEGAKWFWETLVDADLANNTLGWQWTAGCGADAAPYFRIFNPVAQGERFDPEGVYIRRFVPELQDVPPQWIHKPWEAPEKISSYPDPIVDHLFARERALKYFGKMKKVKK